MRRGDVLQRYEAASAAMRRCNEGEGVNLSHQRQQRFLWPRVVVAHALYKEGFTETEIASVMNRHHTTVNYYKHVMKTALSHPLMYPEAVELNEKFKSELYGKQ